MDLIASRHALSRETLGSMAKTYRYNLWTKKHFPYDELSKGDIIFWYESASKSIVWESRVDIVERFEFRNLGEVEKKLKAQFGRFALDKYATDFFKGKNKDGYCLAYSVKDVKRVRIRKQVSFHFPQIGWLSGESEKGRLLLR